MQKPLLFAAAVALAAAAGLASADDHLHRIEFVPGASDGSVKGGVAIGDTDIYAVEGTEGQIATFAVRSEDGDISFSLYAPPAFLDNRGSMIAVQGARMMGGDPIEGRDDGIYRLWKGELPATGTYYLVLASEGGPAGYELDVSVE